MSTEDKDLLLKQYNFPLLIKRAIQEVQGLATAIVYDGKVEDSEIELLRGWVNKNQIAAGEWPLNELVGIMRRILEDGQVTEAERTELLGFLSKLATGPDAGKHIQGVFDAGTIQFQGKSFVFTGQLAFGARSKAVNAVTERGGMVLSGVNLDLDYLIVGEIGSEAWKFGTFGGKLQKAIELRKRGKTKPLIVPEFEFVQAVINDA